MSLTLKIIGKAQENSLISFKKISKTRNLANKKAFIVESQEIWNSVHYLKNSTERWTNRQMDGQSDKKFSLTVIPVTQQRNYYTLHI